MGVETPIPPNMIGAAAPAGALPRRIYTVEIIICWFSGIGFEPDRFMPGSPERITPFRNRMPAVLPVSSPVFDNPLFTFQIRKPASASILLSRDLVITFKCR